MGNVDDAYVPPPLVAAPWSDDQVASLNAFQRAPNWHEFTCPRCRTALVATLAHTGWRCPIDDYTQNWALEFMTNWKWLEVTKDVLLPEVNEP